MLAPSNPGGDFQSFRGAHYNRLGHLRDRCYQLHGRPPRTALVAQFSEPPSPPSQGVTFTCGEYEEFLCLTHAAKSTSIGHVT